MASLDRVNPLTPLTAALLVVVVAYAGPRPWSAALALAAALVMAWCTGVGVRVTWLALVLGVPTFLVLWFMNGVIVPATMSAGGLSLHAAARDARTIVLPLMAAIAALGWAAVGIDPRRLTRALAERGLPAWMVYVLVASFEAVPEARRRAADVLAAQRCRGLTMPGGLLGRARALAPLAGPLMLSLLTESEERALALDARGFQARGRRTAMARVPDRGGERVLRACLWVAIIVLLAWRLIR